ncbi:phage tail protein [Paenibacillus thiaminolyticus]|nr:phage tail protein [Paenibacillus thiaminolyticus]
MLGDIDYLKKPYRPQLFLAKPNGSVISKISEAYDISQNISLSSVNELTFKIPLYLDVNHRLVPNKNIGLLRERYHIRVTLGSKSEWYMIHSIEDSGQEDRLYRQVACFALPYELSDKSIRDYSVESYHAEQVLTELLHNTIWNIGYLDADFKLTYRAFEFGNTTVLDAVYQVAETYNAVVQWDTHRRTVSLLKPELFGVNKGLSFSYGKYLKSIGKEARADEMVTRLKAFGQDGLTIQKVNPTGQNYIENFSYFLYPFERDEQGQVIRHSQYMSDDLCHALLDYEELVESKQDKFRELLAERKTIGDSMTERSIELDKLKKNEAVITDTMISQQFEQKMFFEKYTHRGSSSRSFALNSEYPYAVLCKVSQGGVTVSLDGADQAAAPDRWMLLGKRHHADRAVVAVRGGAEAEVFLQVALISLDELNGANNGPDIIEKFSLDNKQMQIAAKEIEIKNLEQALDNVKANIAELQKTLSADSNFAPELLQELNLYVIEREFSDEKYIDEQDLYEAALEKFKELQRPRTTFRIDIVNFLEIVEEQHNWDKLVVGDWVTIKHERLQIEIEARIAEMTYDYEDGNISLTISNARDVSDAQKRLEKFIYDSKSTSIVVDSNKKKWGQAVVDTSDMSRLFDHFWNKVTDDINMASNEFVTLDRKGLTITDPNDPDRFLRATHGALGLTRSGGLRYDTAITPDGLIAETVLGKIILGQRVVIGDTTGVFTIEGSRLMIDDRCSREVVKLGLLAERPDRFGMIVNRYASGDCGSDTKVNRVSMTADDGFTIERIRHGVYEKTFGTSLDGDLFVKAGVDDQVFTIDKQGLALGSSVWSQAPFHADYLGNVWMNKLFAKDAEIDSSLFKNGHIEGSSLVIGEGNDVFKVYPSIGIWAGHDEFGKAPFRVDMKGNLTAYKGKFVGPAGDVLIDTEAGYIDMDHLDIINVGKLIPEMIQVNTILADKTYVNDLTVNKVKTLPKDAQEGEYVDYIEIQEHAIQFITARVSKSEPAHDSRGRPLYWQDANKKVLTTENTGIVADTYQFDSINVKQKITFERDKPDGSAQPVRYLGIGDGTGDGHGVAIEKKYSGGYMLEYGASATGKKRSLDLRDEGVYVTAKESGIVLDGQDIKAIAKGGTGRFGTERAYIEMTADGKMIFHAVQFDFVNS